MRHAIARLAVATVGVGVLTGLGAVGYYLFAVALFGTLFQWAESMRAATGWPFVVIVPTAGFYLVGILLQVFPRARIGGIREVLAGLEKPTNPVPLVRGVYTFLSCTLLSFGASAGSEGPVAQLGGLFGSRLGHWLRLSGVDIQTLMRAGVAAGTAALFRSPLGGVLFTVELFGARLNWHLLPIAVGAVLGFLVRIAIRGNEYPLEPPGAFDALPRFTLFVLMPVMGILAAFASRFAQWVFRKWNHVFPEGWPLLVRITIGGALVGTIGIWFPQVLSGGYPVIRNAMNGGIGWELFLALFCMKILATSITFGSGGVGGVFAPVFVVGGLFGGAFGFGVHAIAPWAVPQGALFVLLGAILVFACLVKCFWTGLFIIADLTGSYADLLLPALLGGAVAWYVSRRQNPRSIYVD